MSRYGELITIAFLCLTSCADLNYLKRNEAKIGEEQTFTNILAMKYLRYADVLAKNYEWSESRYFANQGVKAYKGKIPDLLRVNVSKTIMDNKSAVYTEMKRLRELLEEATTDEDIVRRQPEKLADAHFYFNCWVFNENRQKNLGKSTKCREEFIGVAGSIFRTNIINKNKKEDVTEKVEGEQAITDQNEQYYFLEFLRNKNSSIYFDLDSYKLNPNALIRISALLKYLNTLNAEHYSLTITGHADRSGKSIYNNNLARRRAETIYNVLVKNGVPRDMIKIDSFGSREPKIITKQGDVNQYNRRVDIRFELIENNMDKNPSPVTKTSRIK